MNKKYKNRSVFEMLLFFFVGDCFPGIIADFEFEITDWIKANKAKARRDAIGELGVRISNSNNKNSITENEALLNLEIARAIRVQINL